MKKFQLSGEQYHDQLHILWNISESGNMITSMRVLAPSEYNQEIDSQYTYSSVAFGNEPKWKDEPGFDLFTDNDVYRWGIEGFLLNLIVKYGGVETVAAEILNGDMKRLKVNGWHWPEQSF